MKSKIKTLASAALAALAMTSLTSCFEQVSNTKLSKEGSGTITETITIGSQFASMIKAQEGQEGASNDLTDETKYKAKAGQMGEGVEFTGLEKKDLDDGSMQIVAGYTYTDINNLKSLMGDDDDSNPITYKLEKGDVNKLTINMPKVEAADADPEKIELTDEEKAAQKQQLQMMAGMMEGMRMTATIEVEGEVVKTDADFADGNVITLFDMEIGKIFKNEKAMEKLTDPEDLNDIDALRKLAKEVDGLKIEPDPTITVEFK